MPDPNESYPHKVVLLGSLPPLGALSSYCLELSLSISNMIDVEFISFQKIYPSFLYPGGNMKGDYTFPNIHHPKLQVRRQLTWYNPLTWIKEGLITNGALLHAQWWSPPPVFCIFYYFSPV